jgi:hypothetical protein
MTNPTLGAQLDELAALKQAAKDAQLAADKAKLDMELYQARLFERMEEEDALSHRTSTGGYSAKRTIYASVNDSEAYEAWLEQEGLLEEFTRRTPEKGRLNELVRQCLDLREEPPPGVAWYERKYISVTTD